jgi:hypothetical protein
MAAYEAAIFFDNDPKHIQELQNYCNNSIKLVLVGGTTGSTSNIIKPLPEVYRTDFGAIGEGKNPYYDFLNGQRDTYDELSGFKEEHEEILDAWIAETNGKKRTAMFDWDRTISKIEGYLFPTGPYSIQDFRKFYNKPTTTAEHINQYLCGGIQRYNYMKSIMQKCKDNGIDIVIVSNNGMCTLSPSFNELVADICGEPIPIPYPTPLPTPSYTIICSKNIPWLGHKGKALRGKYPSLCSKPIGSIGGKRKTHRRKFSKRRKHTRSRK